MFHPTNNTGNNGFLVAMTFTQQSAEKTVLYASVTIRKGNCVSSDETQLRIFMHSPVLTNKKVNKSKKGNYIAEKKKGFYKCIVVKEAGFLHKKLLFLKKYNL